MLNTELKMLDGSSTSASHTVVVYEDAVHMDASPRTSPYRM